MLEIDNIETYYAESQALFGVSLAIEQGQLPTHPAGPISDPC